MNHYETLGILERYHLDAAQLRMAFLQRSRESHPDHSSGMTDVQQAEQLQQSAVVNLAFRLLQRPDTRLQHLLELHNVWHPDTGQNTPQQPEFLMLMMELNEEAETTQHDPARRQALLHQLEGHVALREEHLNGQMQPFDATTDPTTRAQMLQQVLPVFMELRTLLRTRERLVTFAAPL